MMHRNLFAALTIATLSCGGLAGCSDDGTKNLPDAKAKPLTQAESDQIAKQVEEGMKAGYKGAPGAPLKSK